MLAKIFGGLSLILTISLIFAGMQIRYLNKEVETLEGNNERLESSVQEQKETISKNIQLADASQERESDLRDNLDKVNDKNTEYSNQINQLRATENARALQEPYKRGVAASSRLKSLWMRIENKTIDDIDASSSTAPNNS